MAAIITDRLKLAIVDEIVTIMEDATDPTYIGFAKSEVWNDSDTAPIPLNNLDEIAVFTNPHAKSTRFGCPESFLKVILSGGGRDAKSGTTRFFQGQWLFDYAWSFGQRVMWKS